MLKPPREFVIVIEMEGMEIQLELFGPLDKYYPPEAAGRPCHLRISPETTARALVKSLNLPDNLNVLVYVNLKQVPDNEDRDLADGDTVGVMPAMPGG